MASIHGHEVLHMMTNNIYATDEALLDAIDAKFGREAKFHTCSKEGMTAQELVIFLKGKKKFKSTDNGFTVNVENICNH